MSHLKPFIYPVLFFFCWSSLNIYDIAEAAVVAEEEPYVLMSYQDGRFGTPFAFGDGNGPVDDGPLDGGNDRVQMASNGVGGTSAVGNLHNDLADKRRKALAKWGKKGFQALLERRRENAERAERTAGRGDS